MFARPKALPCCLLVVVLVCYLRPESVQAQELGPFSPAGRLCAVLEYQSDGPTLPSFSDDRPSRHIYCARAINSARRAEYIRRCCSPMAISSSLVETSWRPRGPRQHRVAYGQDGSSSGFRSRTLARILHCLRVCADRQPRPLHLGAIFSLTSETAQGNYFAKLSDEGTFTISAGTPSAPGKQVFSNNVNDPVESVDIESIAYDFEHVRSSPPEQRTGATQLCVNNIPGEFTCNLSLALSYTKTNTFTFSANQSIQLGYKSTAKVGLPGVGEVSSEWSITGTVGFMEGRSDADSQARTFTSTGSVVVPPQTTYRASIVGAEVDGTIPFTYTGTATYKSGKTARLVDVQGEYNGVDTGEFTVQVTCVQRPGGCPPGFLEALPAVATQ
jgi:hypothetical protein